MATKSKQTEAVEAIEQLTEAIEAFSDETPPQSPEVAEAWAKFWNGEITWDELVALLAEIGG